MKVIIGGIGSIGMYVTKYLLEEGFDVTVIDVNANKVRAMSDNESVAGIIGDLTDIETLKTANIEEADIFIATTQFDELNIVACQLANTFGVRYNICSIQYSKYYSEEWKDLIRKRIIPIDDLISVGNSTIISIVQQVKYSYLKISNMLTFFNNTVKMFSIYCEEESSVINKTISSIYEEIDDSIPFKIIGIQRNNNFNLALENDIIKENDKIFVVVEEEHIKTIYSIFFNLEASENKFLESQSPNIIISGDHPFIKLLAISLAENYNRVKVITNNINEIENNLLALDLEKYGVQLISDDITKDEYRNNYLKSEDDIIIIMNQDDDTTVLKTLYLKYQKVGNLFCFLKDDNYEDFLASYKINHIINPSYFIMSPILSHIRRGVIMNAYSLNKKTEAMEILVTDNSRMLGKRVEEIEKNRNVIVAMILDENGNIVNLSKKTIIRSNYQLILVILRKYIKEIEENILQSIDNSV